MNQYENNAYFWQKLDTLFVSSEIEITNKSGSRHAQYANLIYPVDFGCLSESGTSEKKVFLFRGSQKQAAVQSIIVMVDILEKALDTRVLIGCTADEEQSILRFLNQTDFQKIILVRRGNEVPEWALDE